MSKEDPSEKLALLFEEAMELATPEEQSEFLDRACGGDSDLRQQVEQFLQSHREAGGFLRADARLEADAWSATELENAGEVKPGDWLGSYHLLGLVGEGGSSIVYLAEQEKPVRRWVALKVIKAGMDTHQIVARFELERQALAVMDHPGIAKVFDAGATPRGRPFFVMELVRGMQITRHCDQHRLSLPQRLELFIQVCQAVLHAHQKGIVHRDIKPDNILVSMHDGRPFPKVIDFGIAKVLHGWKGGSTPGTGGMPFLGTPAYMSPEQTQVTMPDLDTRTDIYSLGALLHELLVGHPPFDHQSLMAAGLETMCHIIRTQEPCAPSARLSQLPLPEQRSIAHARNTTPDELRRAITGDLDWVTLKAIEKDREQRYKSCAHLADDIESHLQNLPVSAAAPTLRYRFSKMVQRNRAVVMTATAISIVLLGSAVINFGLAIHARSSARRAQELQTAAVAAERQSHRSLVGMHVSSALAASDEGNYDRAALWFANAASAAGRDDPEIMLNLRRAMAWLSRTPVPAGAFQLASAFNILEFAKSSRYLLAVDRDNGCSVWDCAANVRLDWSTTVGPVRAAAWHPDGAQLVLVLPDKGVQLRSIPDGAILRTVAVGEDVRAVAFSLDGEFLLFGSRILRALHLRTGSMLQQSWPHPEPVIGLGVASHANQVITASADGVARVLSLVDGPARIGNVPAAPHRPFIRVDSCSSKTMYRQDFLEIPVLALPALAAEGKLLVTRTDPYEISIWDVGTARLVRKFEEMCCSCRFILSPDGLLLAGGLHGGRVAIWDVTTGREQALLTSNGACILDLDFGPAGEHLVTAQAHGVARIWALREGRTVLSAMHHSAEVDKVAFAPNGEMVATGQADGLVRVWALPASASKGHRIASAKGPKVVRMDPERNHFVTAREPAWKDAIRTATIYSAHTGKPVGPPMELDGNLEDVALSPGCRLAAVAFGLPDNEATGIVEFRDVQSGQITSQTKLVSAASSLSWDPKEKRVAAICHSGQLLLIELGSNDPVTWTQPLNSTLMRVHPFVRFTPDGDSLISLTPAGTLEVREAATGHLRYPALRAELGGFWHFTISRDGQFFASTTRNGRVNVWHVQTGTLQGSPLYHPARVDRCQFSADGRLLVTASHDGRARVWDLRSGQQSDVPLVHPNEVYDAAFTPDGRWVLTACRDGGVRIWDWKNGQLIAPGFKVGDQAFMVEVTADGNYAVIGSLDKSIHVLSLCFLKEKVRWSCTELCLAAEVVSGSIVENGMIREMTTAEWLRSAKKFWGNHPELMDSASPATLGFNLGDRNPLAREPIAARALRAASAVCPRSSTCGLTNCSSFNPKQ